MNRNFQIPIIEPNGEYFEKQNSFLKRKMCSLISYIGCSFKFIPKVGVEESIVNAPLVRLQSKNTNNTKSEVSFKQLIRDL
jgi:hypothetical protein